MKNGKLWIIIGTAILGAVASLQIFPELLVSVVQYFQGIGLSPENRALLAKPAVPIDLGQPTSILGLMVLGMILGAGVGNIILKMAQSAQAQWNKKDSSDKITILLSLFAGVLVSLPFLSLTEKFNGFFSFVMTTAMVAGASVMAMYAFQSMGDVLPWLKHRSRFRKKTYKILDTNVIIDGRIYDVIRSGFLEGNLYVPGFVLDELQHIADSQDALRRQRGRRGLEVLRLLQAEFSLEVRVLDKMIADIGDEVDSRLVRLAKMIGGDIVTNDFNLNRVAILQEVTVLNINELALALKPNVLPRETLAVTIIREGNHPGQGVGYLEDGTMVVVENGKPAVGESTDVVVSQVIQTERGRMIFAEIPEEESDQYADSARKKKAVRA